MDTARIGRGLTVLLLVSLLIPAFAWATTYQEIQVPYPSSGDRARLFFHPDLEVMGFGDGVIKLLSRPELTAELEARGFQVKILIPDLEQHYKEQLGNQRGYGIFHTWEQTVQAMNDLHTQYPNLTTAPVSIGTTGEGRTIWAIKIATNPNVQTSKPEVLYDAVHHAREPIGLEDLLHFMTYLCANYGTDPVITYLVANRRMWFVPIVNVDGYVYNETTNPNGGGMWRKNRRNNGDGCYGVDNNRNYPYQWVGGGSSPDPCDDTYRGPSAGSEPENQAQMGLINAHHFVTWQSYHSNAGMVLFPWGYTNTHTPDDATFRAVSKEMAKWSGYETGQPGEILYFVNGDSFDWGYGETDQHQKIFALTTEIAGSGFWPQPSEVPGLISENLHSDIFLAQTAGVYLSMTGSQVTGGDGNGRLDPGETASLVITVKNVSLINAATNVQATLQCQDPYVNLKDASSKLGTIATGTTVSSTLDPFTVTIDPTCPQGRSVNFTVHLTGDGGLVEDCPIATTIGQAPVLYSDTFEQSGSEWTKDATENCKTGTFVRIVPVATNFQPGTTPFPGTYAWVTAQNPNGNDSVDDVDGGIAATRSPQIDLSTVSHVQLSLNYFHGQLTGGDDPTGDYFRIDISNNGGTTFPVNLVQIGDVTTTPDWKSLQVNLEQLIPLTAHMVIRVQVSDGTAADDIIEGGIDNVSVFDRGTGNQPPSAPTLIAPADSSFVLSTPTLTVANAVDPEGDQLTYGFRVYADANLTQLVASVDGVAQGTGSTSWTVPQVLPSGATYWWRAYAADPTSRGLYMTTARFVVQDPTSVSNFPRSFPTLTASPNPASSDVILRYYTPSTPNSKIEIVDASGRLVRSLEGARWTEGWQETRWDGRDDNGQRAPAGVYWVRLALPGEVRTIRLVRIMG